MTSHARGGVMANIRWIMVVFIIGLMSLLMAGPMTANPNTQQTIFRDRFEPDNKPPPAPPPPIHEATGQIFKGPYRPGSELILTPLNEDLLQLATRYRGDVINAQGHYRLSALIPQGPVELTATGYFFNELTGQTSDQPLTLSALTQAKAKMHVNLITHLESTRVRALVAAGHSFAHAKAQALEELMIGFGFSSSLTDASEMAIDGEGAEALMAISAILITQPDGQTRHIADLQALITTLREDLGDGALTSHHQTLIIDSAAAAQALASTFDQHLKSVFDQAALPIDLKPIRPSLLQTLEHNAHAVTIVQTQGGTLTPAGTHWRRPGATLTTQVSADVGHHLLHMTGTCPGSWDSAQQHFTTDALIDDCTLEAAFSINRYAVTGTLMPGASLMPALPASVAHGEAVTFTITPPTGFELVSISGCGGTLTGTIYTTDEITSDCAIETQFIQKTYSVGATLPAGATTNPAIPHTVIHGDVLSFTITPPTGFDGIEASGCGGSLVGRVYTTQAITQDCDLQLSFYQKFLLAPNGVTVLCPRADIGDEGTLNGMTYTKRDRTQINAANAATTCISGVTDLSGLFADEASFNGGIGHWDTEAVTQMDGLFRNAQAFNQDLGGWCVAGISTPPTDFDLGASAWDVAKARPNWGMDCALLDQTHTLTLSSNAGGSLSDEGEVSALHGRRKAFDLTVDSGYGLVAVTGCGGSLIGARYVTGVITGDCSVNATFSPFYLADNGVTIKCEQASVGDQGTVGGITYTKRDKADITAINAATTCTSGITNMQELFLNQTTFNEAIGHWDTSSVTTMAGMFYKASAFDGDITHWDTSAVTVMNYMFYQASTFGQDLSGWCVENVSSPVWAFRDGSQMLASDEPPFGQPCATP